MTIKLNQEWLQSSGKYKCPHCLKEYSKKGICTHIWKKHGEGLNHDPNRGYKVGTRKVWNKGLKKETNESLQKMATTLSERYSGENGHFYGKRHTKETLEKLKKNGGYRKGSGRGKQGLYKGYWCDSSWELAFVIYNLEHDIKFVRNTKKFSYEFEGKKKNYIPDFIMEDGTYVEIKGYDNGLTQAKISFFPHKIKLIAGKKQIKLYLDYVESKYGKDFIKLYETREE